MRHRETTTGSFTDVNHQYYRTRPAPYTGSYTLVSDTVTYTGEQTVKAIDDVALPGFGHLVKCGKFLPINPVVISTTQTIRHVGSVSIKGETFYSGTWRQSQYWEGTRWFWNTPLLSLAAIDDTISQYVTNKAIAECRGSLWDVLTFLGELRETVEMIASKFHGIDAYAQRAARRAGKRSRNYGEALKAFRQYWLEYRYGWRPLCHDVAQALISFSTKRHRHELVRGRGYQSQSLDDSKVTLSSQNLGNSVTRNVIVTETYSGQRTYRGVAYGEVGDPSIAQWGSDPFVTAWELIPYSFVMDWFIQVGDYLQAISPFQAGSLVGAGYSIRDEYEYYQEYQATDSGGNSAYRQSGTHSGIATTIKVAKYQRIAFSAGLPGWNPRLSDVKLIDLVALVTQRMKSVDRLLRKR